MMTTTNMRLYVASPAPQWSQHAVPRSTAAAPEPTASSFASSSSSSKAIRPLVSRFIYPTARMSANFSNSQSQSQSLHNSVSRSPTKNPSFSAKFDEFYSQDSPEQIEFWARTSNFTGEEKDQDYSDYTCTTLGTRISRSTTNSSLVSNLQVLAPQVFGISPEPPNWPERESVLRVSIERKANSGDLPLSLRMIMKRKKLQKGFRVLEESASWCSVKRAFSSMVFTFLELKKCCGFQMRDQIESEASFVWLFQQVFSQTPNLMVHLMSLIASFSIYSMTKNIAIQDHELLLPMRERQSLPQTTYDSLAKKSNSLSNFTIGHRKIDPVGDQIYEEEVVLWNSMVEEAMRMQMEQRGEVLDHETMRCFVSQINVGLEPDDHTEYSETKLFYHMILSQEPNNPLLLCNYARFLFLVAGDNDSAEEYFKRALRADSQDAESLSQYANFLWVARKDQWGAEERYIQAMAAEPDNHYYASTYANFLWSTGGEETCFPLNAPTKHR